MTRGHKMSSISLSQSYGSTEAREQRADSQMQCTQQSEHMHESLSI